MKPLLYPRTLANTSQDVTPPPPKFYPPQMWPHPPWMWPSHRCYPLPHECCPTRQCTVALSSWSLWPNLSSLRSTLPLHHPLSQCGMVSHPLSECGLLRGFVTWNSRQGSTQWWQVALWISEDCSICVAMPNLDNEDSTKSGIPRNFQRQWQLSVMFKWLCSKYSTT